MHGVGQQGDTAARHVDDDLQRGSETEGDQRDPDRADGELVIDEGGIASQVGVAVVMREAGQMQRHGDFDEDIVAVVVVIVLALVRMAVRMCHCSRLGIQWRSVASLS